MNTRVFVFGIDAASPLLIERWLDDLPNLRRITKQGTWGNLRSTIPPFTSPAWACMVTGKNPAKVGIFGLRHRQEGQYKFRAPTSDFRCAPAIWDIAGQFGKRSFVVNVPDTYPPTPILGAMVSGRPAPVDAGAPITTPPELGARLDQLTGGYRVGPTSAFDDESQPEEFPAWVDVLNRQQATLEHLMDTQDWDLFFYVSMAIDGISHHFWKHLDPSHPDHDPAAAAQFGDTMRQIYILEDRRIGRILDRLSPDDLLLVVSDHGSAPCYRHVAVNNLLIEHDFLVLKQERPRLPTELLRPLTRLAFDIYRRAEWVRRLARPFRSTVLRDAVVHWHFAQRTHGRLPFDALPVDWEHTTAYYLGDDRLYLNVAGREPQGSVQAGEEYSRKREALLEMLSAARDPESGKPLFANVFPREEIYDGPYLAQAPDLILVPGDPHWNLGGAVGPTIVDRPLVSGKHHPEGVFLALGAGARAGQQTAASIYDISPTILHVLGLSIPDDTDGHAQLNWFNPESPTAQRPVSTAQYSEVNFAAHTWTKQEEAQVEERLRELGYLD